MEENKEIKEELHEEIHAEETAPEGLDLHEQYAKKAAEMKEKYHEAIYAIADTRGVPVGDAFDMLKAVCRGGDYLEGIEVEVDLDELKKDTAELTMISDQIAKANGLI